MDANVEPKTCPAISVRSDSQLAPAQTSWIRRALQGFLLGGILALVLHYGHLLLTDNLHTLLPGRFYRSSQLSPAKLDTVVHRLGIRTIINLRGICDGCDFYLDQCRTAHHLGVSQEDIGFSAGRLPPVDELRWLVRALDRSESPMLIHCRQGVDRTGLVSGLILLLYGDATLEEARNELGIQYGHVALGRTVWMLRFFDLYENWLKARGTPHSRLAFREWLEKDYCPGPDGARLEVTEGPSEVPIGQPWSMRVRLHNTSPQTWHFHPEATAGVHCGYTVTDSQGRFVMRNRAGLLRKDVPPGECIDLTLLLPPVNTAGTCYVMVDMMDEAQQCWFYQTGSKPLVVEVPVVP